MLSKIISIQNIGRFENSNAKPNPNLKKHTIVFAPNAAGKSTICAILRSLSSGDPTEILGRRRLGRKGEPRVDLMTSSGKVTYSDQTWSKNTTTVSIFDSAFIERNVYSGSIVDLSNRRQLYRVIIGQKGAKLAEEEANLSELAKEKQAKIREAEKMLESVAKGMSLKNYIELEILEDPEKSIADKTALIESLKVSDSIASKKKLDEYDEISIPSEILSVLATDIDTLSDKAEATLKKHFEQHSMEEKGQAWVEEGLSYVVDDTCPLCGRSPLKDLPLIQAFRGLLGEQYQKLRTQVQNFKNFELDKAYGTTLRTAISKRFESNSLLLDFWKKHCEFVSVPESVHSIIEAVRAIDNRLQKHLEQKLGAISEAAISDQDRIDIEALFDAANDTIGATNSEIRAINAIIEEKKLSVDCANFEAEEEALNHLQLQQSRHRSHESKLCSLVENLWKEKADIDEKKKKVRLSLNEYTKNIIEPYEKQINVLLRRFQASFSIAKTNHSYAGGVATSSYVLRINNVEIGVGDSKTSDTEPSFKNTLSSGDKSTLALAFFLAHLQNEERLEERIVVFDDPFNSQDAFRRAQTTEQILLMAKRCGQPLVLSHDQQFTWDIWARLPKSERVALQIAYSPSAGSKIQELDVETLNRGRTTQEIDELKRYLDSRQGNPIDIIKKMRGVCESRFRLAFTGFFGADDSLGEILRKIREGYQDHEIYSSYDTLDQINEYTKAYHHGENFSMTVEKPIDSDELATYVEMTLELVCAIK